MAEVANRVAIGRSRLGSAVPSCGLFRVRIRASPDFTGVAKVDPKLQRGCSECRLIRFRTTRLISVDRGHHVIALKRRVRSMKLIRWISAASLSLIWAAGCGTDTVGVEVGAPECDDGYVYSEASGTCVFIESGVNSGMDTPDGQWADSDSDGVVDRFDNCPTVYNPDQADSDSDGVGDACDNCRFTANADQLDTDGNGVGDACQDEDFYDTDQDTDGDGVPDLVDNCPNDANADQLDSDGDGVGDVCDNCQNTPNPAQIDSSGNGVGDRCDPDHVGDICLSETFDGDVTTIEPSIYIMLDASGSMADELEPDRPRPWPIDLAQDAIGDVADALNGTVRIGLGQYPFQQMSGSTCTVNNRLDVAMHSASAIKTAANAIEAVGNTPTGYALNQILDQGLLDDPSDSLNTRRPKAAILITDGDPTVACDSGSPDNRRIVAQPEAVAAAQRLSNAGIPVYVVGFISGAEPEKLNEIAIAGGTNAPGNDNFYTANDAAQLTAAIQSITQQTVSCSYQVSHVPNDLDRVWVEIDSNPISEDPANGFTFDRFAGLVTLNGSACDTVRNAPNPTNVQIKVEITCLEEVQCVPEEEVCDFEDNDCDGEIDEGCDSCRPEVCDGVDNDCDDRVDEGCPQCEPLGQSCTADADCCVGSCDDGVCTAECRPLEIGCVNNADCCSGACSGSASSPGVCVAN